MTAQGKTEGRHPGSSLLPHIFYDPERVAQNPLVRFVPPFQGDSAAISNATRPFDGKNSSDYMLAKMQGFRHPVTCCFPRHKMRH